MYHHHNHHFLPYCLHCHPHSYIRMVQHLIERCLLLHMSLDQCIKALEQHASIRPLVTLTGSSSSSLYCGESYKRRIETSFMHTSMLYLPGPSL
ncbi:hypothetical protein FEM48_ZijujUnG0050200 [Ziziphus jujuba var. spinosa]|uniref:Uncharacterized protein n=1 Tax=Ziziphus jujuba var. spinosa TaxID=714518 RepID=A0A978U941_ZIZJJ|nr:hypothetical protein FEM48_ZijujUnG0093600 [Ziziphus jujuba var. spinosa]KAH7511050.1 hypothetical protein FEM48_ZijujUnG0050200 [Ziziphus jujuba var. spinosa]